MATRLSGTRFLNLGEKWRNEFISGVSILEISQNEKQNQQTVSRAIWLAKIPNDVREKIKKHPEIFTRQILLDTFAAKRKQCEKNNFILLRTEIEKMILKGAGSKPKLKNTNKCTTEKPKKLAKQNKSNSKINPIYNIENALTAELKLKNKLCHYHCRIAFNNEKGGEITIFFNNEKELNEIIDKI